MALVIEVGDVSSDNGDNVSDASHDLNIPAYADGDLVILFLGIGITAVASANAVTWPTGPNAESITEVVNQVNSGSSTGDVGISIGWFIGDGANASPASATWTYGGNGRSVLDAVVVPSGEFDSTTPISAQTVSATGGSGVGAPGAFTAASDDGGGKYLWLMMVDSDSFGDSAPTGYTTLANNDAGRLTHVLFGRDAAVTNSESIAAVSSAGFTYNDDWCVYGIIVREVVAGGSSALPLLNAYYHG